MLDARLTLAFDASGFAWPTEGTIAVFHPGEDANLRHVPKERSVVIQPFFPAHAAFAGQGFVTAVDTSDQPRFSAAIVCLPRAKSEALSLIAAACASTDGPVLVDGQKTDGVDSILKAIRARVSVEGPLSKAHGKLFWFSSCDAFADWASGPSLTPGGFWTAPGVFSADGIDPASAMLADALPDKLGAQVADLGAGWGYLSAHLLTREDIHAVHLVEAGHMALECARRNVTDPRAVFHWADVVHWQPPALMDTVVMNPPFHTSRAADPEIGRAFVAVAARILAPRGQLWMVANRHLPYEATLSALFAKVEEVGGDARFKLLHCTRPTRKRK